MKKKTFNQLNIEKMICRSKRVNTTSNVTAKAIINITNI